MDGWLDGWLDGWIAGHPDGCANRASVCDWWRVQHCACLRASANRSAYGGVLNRLEWDAQHGTRMDEAGRAFHNMAKMELLRHLDRATRFCTRAIHGPTCCWCCLRPQWTSVSRISHTPSLPEPLNLEESSLTNSVARQTNELSRVRRTCT